MKLLKSLLKLALETKRRSGTDGERKFVAAIAKLFPPDMLDEAGNVHFDCRQGFSRTLFVAHSDTMSRGQGEINTVLWKENSVHAVDDVLGADNGAGLALMLHLMACKVPGYYIVTRSEELGGIGAEWLVNSMPSLLKQFDRAITFDRRECYSVISHQRGGPCCSEAFAQDLADKLNEQDATFMYSPDPTGIFTDTAMFVGIIPNCTNISVGYKHEHSKSEWLNLDHYYKLAKAATKVDWENLDQTEISEESDTDPAFMDALDAAAFGDPSALNWYVATELGIQDLQEVEDTELDPELGWSVINDEPTGSVTEACHYMYRHRKLRTH